LSDKAVKFRNFLNSVWIAFPVIQTVLCVLCREDRAKLFDWAMQKKLCIRNVGKKAATANYGDDFEEKSDQEELDDESEKEKTPKKKIPPEKRPAAAKPPAKRKMFELSVFDLKR
jgi:hypothetical protein